ncbi:hypothetical protein ACOBQJ_03100 [Pelotomaculum propionicicum]|uniref:hypothetical protein n=1 Tax=Pelotomaculum propionicicum TaxID=258475 RepID=UPI003B7C0A17
MILKVTPVIDYNVRTLCTTPYPGHKYGCPNYNKKEGCPPKAPKFEEIFNMDGFFYAIINRYNLRKHVLEMRLKHPGWTQRQLRNLLYWQPTARKQLLTKIRDFHREHRGFHITACPEALGVNVTLTLANAGYNLEWPPEHIACQIAIAGLKGEP